MDASFVCPRCHFLFSYNERVELRGQSVNLNQFVNLNIKQRAVVQERDNFIRCPHCRHMWQHLGFD